MARYLKYTKLNIEAEYNANLLDYKVDFNLDLLNEKVRDYKMETVNVNPVIEGMEDINFTVGDTAPDYTLGVTAYDEQEGDLTDKITIDDEDVNLTVDGTYEVIYSVEDKYGNETIEKIKVIVTSAT